MKKRCKALLCLTLMMATLPGLQAQDFGAKSITPSVFLLGGGFSIPTFHINSGSLPPMYRASDNANIENLIWTLQGAELYANLGFRMYLGATGLYLEPNTLLSIGYASGQFYCYSITQEKIKISYTINNIIPSLNVGYDFGFDDDGFGVGAVVAGLGLWGSFFYNPTCRDKTKVQYDISNLSSLVARFIATLGWRSDFRSVCVNCDYGIGFGKPFGSVACKLLDYDFTIDKPIFMMRISVLKKYQKY